MAFPVQDFRAADAGMALLAAKRLYEADQLGDREARRCPSVSRRTDQLPRSWRPSRTLDRSPPSTSLTSFSVPFPPSQVYHKPSMRSDVWVLSNLIPKKVRFQGDGEDDDGNGEATSSSRVVDFKHANMRTANDVIAKAENALSAIRSPTANKYTRDVGPRVADGPGAWHGSPGAPGGVSPHNPAGSFEVTTHARLRVCDTIFLRESGAADAWIFSPRGRFEKGKHTHKGGVGKLPLVGGDKNSPTLNRVLHDRNNTAVTLRKSTGKLSLRNFVEAVTRGAARGRKHKRAHWERNAFVALLYKKDGSRTGLTHKQWKALLAVPEEHMGARPIGEALVACGVVAVQKYVHSAVGAGFVTTVEYGPKPTDAVVSFRRRKTPREDLGPYKICLCRR